MMSELVCLTVLDGVAVIRIDNPPVNALSPGVPEGLARAVASAEADVAAVAMVVIGQGSTFVAGADIATLERATWGDTSALPDIHDLLRAGWQVGPTSFSHDPSRPVWRVAAHGPLRAPTTITATVHRLDAGQLERRRREGFNSSVWRMPRDRRHK